MGGVRLDSYTVVLLVRSDDAPELDEQDAAELQDMHMTYLAELHDAGQLLAAGPLGDERLRGLCIFASDAQASQALIERDPAVQAGRYSVQVIPWLLPEGAVSFTHTRFPRRLGELDE